MSTEPDSEALRQEIIDLLDKLDGADLADTHTMVQIRAMYRDDTCPERACEHCGQPYRGPTACCSLRCALAAA